MIKFSYIFIFFFIFVSLEARDTRALLYDGNCFTCHKTTQSKSAPSMKQVKQIYLNAFAKKEDFVAYMSQWVLHPNPKTSLMHQAIQKYELMPELGYDLATLKEISGYIYDYEF